MDAGSVTVMSGGDWTRTGTLTLNATSKVLYTTADQSTMTDLDYGHIEHDGGDLGQEGALVVLGTFTNTSGDFAASENLQAKGIIWTDGAVTENPEQEWAIGTDGIIINGGTFVATTGTFTVEGNWFKDGGTLTATNSTVNFNGATAQTITSGGGVFYSVSISNTSAAEVSLLDPFEFNGSGTLTIDDGAVFATAGNDFNDNGGTITNIGTFEIHGDEQFSTENLSIPGDTKVVDPEGSILTTTLSGLENVEFNSNGNTITLGEDTDYITGNIIIAVGTTFNMDAHGLTVADDKTVTNYGTWSAPDVGSTLTCAGTATFAGNDMNFYDFSATSTNTDTIIFQRGKTYTVANALTLEGGDGVELYLKSDDGEGYAVIEHTGEAQSVDYVRVLKVDGTAEHHIAATNSWDVDGTLSFWDFAPMLYTFDTTGNWDELGSWEQNAVPSATDNILVNAGQILTLNGDKTINDIDVDGTIAVGSDVFTVNGASDIDGTIIISTGTMDANSVFDATFGMITFTEAGNLTLDSTVTSLGTLTNVDFGTVTYDAAGAQDIVAGDYPSLKASNDAGAKTLAGAVTVAGDLTIDTDVTIAMDANNLTVAGDTDINGTVTISIATLDANGAFDATGGNITFSDAGNLLVAGDVESLGTLSENFGTVNYDGDDARNILAGTYNNLTASGDATKTLVGAVTVNGALTIDAGVTVDMNENTLGVTGATDIDGTLDVAGSALALNGASDIDGTITISTGTVDADGSFDATGGNITFTGAGELQVAGEVESLGALSDDFGTVTYDGATDRNIFTTDYNNLTASGDAIKTLVGDVTVNGALTIDDVTTIAMDANNLTVAGDTDINGTVTISTATLDADGTFDAEDGTITFTGAGELQVAGEVESLGTLSEDFGTVHYDGDTDRDIFEDDYYNLTASGAATKTLGGDVTVDNDLVIDDGVTVDVSENDYAINIGGNLTNGGTFTSQDGTITFSGSNDQEFTTGGNSFHNIIFNNAGGNDKLLVISGNLVIDNDLTLTTGTLDLDTNDPDISIGGDLTISDGAVWTKSDETVTFDGATQSLSDANNTPNDLGDALINSTEMTVTTDATFTSVQISSASITIVNPSVSFTVNEALTITGELEMADVSVVDAGGDVTVATTGILDMDGTSRLKMEEDLSFSGIMEASATSRIDLDGSSTQTISGAPVEAPAFNRLFCSSSATVFSIDATISDSLDAGGEDFTIEDGATLTMDAGSVTVISGGDWTRTDGTLTLDADSKVLYTTDANSTMAPEVYGHIEHNGGTLIQEGALVVLGTFTNTSGNFAASQNITAGGIVWTAGH
jgi:hypothetical protein